MTPNPTSPATILRNERLYSMSFGSIYKLYITKVEKKGRTINELNTVIFWLTGYDQKSLDRVIEDMLTNRDFFEHAPMFNPNADKIKGVICGYRIEDIQDQLMKKIRYLDKLVDELAKGKTIDKILRQ